MDVLGFVKEEPEDNEVILTRADVPDIVLVHQDNHHDNPDILRVHQDNNHDNPDIVPVHQNNHDDNLSTNTSVNIKDTAVNVKMESSELWSRTNGVSSKNYHNIKKKKRLSSTLAKILNSKHPPAETQNIQPVTVVTNSRHSSLLFGLLNGPKLPLNPDISQSVKPVRTSSNGNSDQGKSIPKVTPGLKSPLLSSMLKNKNGLPGHAKTNAAIDHVFSNTVGSVDKPSNITLSEMLGHRKRANTEPAPFTKLSQESNLNQIKSPEVAKMLKIDSTVGTVISTGQNISELRNANYGISDSKTETVANDSADELINEWSKLITQRVIADFSKDVNHTLNSFVKKAIIDNIKTTPSHKLTEAGSFGDQLPKELSRVSDLASSMLRLLAEYCGLPQPGMTRSDIVKDNESKPREVTPSNVIEIDSDHDDMESSKISSKSETSSHIGKLGKSTTINENVLLTPTYPSQLESHFASNSFDQNNHLNNEIKTSHSHSGNNQEKDLQNRILVTFDDAGNMIIKNENLPEDKKRTDLSSEDTNQSPASTSKTPEISPALNFLNIQHVQDKDGKFLIFTCNICGKRFQHHGTLVVHKRTHLMESGKSDFVCDICGKVCTAERYLQVHMRTHERDISLLNKEQGKFNFPCDVCKKVFSSEEHLTIHKRLHLGLKLYECHICKTSFTRRSQLEIHLRTHSGKKPHKCVMCDKSFSQFSGLRKHLKIHDESKPYNCEICAQGFTRKAHFERHMRKEYGVKPFTCSQCRKGFHDKTSLNAHKKLHEKSNNHFCEECGKGFKTENGIHSHMKFHTGEKGFNCVYCAERYELKKELTQHMISVHKEEAWNLQVENHTRNSTIRPYTETYSLSDEDDDDYEDEETDDENVSSYDNEDCIDGDESDNENKKSDLGFSDMVTHIKEDIESSQKAEQNLKDSAICVSDKLKTEPVEYDTLKIQFHGHEHDFMNFDPTVVKDEPSVFIEESCGFSQVDLNSHRVKSEQNVLK